MGLEKIKCSHFIFIFCATAMPDFARKSKELNKSTTLKPGYVADIDPFVPVETLDNAKLRTPRYQLPENSPYENYNLYRYTASRNISGILGTGDPVQVYLTRGSGRVPLSIYMDFFFFFDQKDDQKENHTSECRCGYAFTWLLFNN